MIKHCHFCGDKEVETGDGVGHCYDVYVRIDDREDGGIAACNRCAQLALEFVKGMINDLKERIITGERR